MTETARSLLRHEIGTLRHDVLKAGVLNAKLLQESAESHVAQVGTLLRASAELDDASFRLVDSIIVFARLLYGQADVAEAETARRAALAAIERLADLVGSAPIAADLG